MTFFSPVFPFIIVACQLFGLANTGDDVFHVVDGDGLDALESQFVEQLGDADFDVVDDFVAVFLPLERLSERLHVLL